jgi:very-short-patch-repair endonuclease
LSVNYGTLKLWINGLRSLPAVLVKKWKKKYNINPKKFRIKMLNLKKVLKKASEKGVLKLKKKYGKDWMKLLGKKGKKKLDQLFKKDVNLLEKWKNSVRQALFKKYGSDAYKIIGRKGGKRFLEKIEPEKLKKQLEKAFRKSLDKYRIEIKGFKLRSRKEAEVLNLLLLRNINFEYEKKIFGFYPDFYLPPKTIIEVVGLEWKPRIKRVLSKFKILLQQGFKLIVYTYPNMRKYFKNLPITVVTDIKSLDEVLVYNRV